MERTIRTALHYSYYGLLFLVPLAMYHKTSELFEFNKMIVVYVFTTLILFFWASRSVVRKKFIFQKTFLDIPIILFLASQFVSTIMSFDTRTSLFGYYSRFNGGFISILCYSILYWGYVSNFDRDKVVKTIYVVFFSSLLVSIYAILQHLGIDAHIWVQDVQNRVFSTLGQPNWLAAYIVCITPITWFLTIKNRFKISSLKESGSVSRIITHNSFTWLFLSSLFFLVLLYTKSRSGYVGFFVLSASFWLLSGFQYFVGKKNIKDLVIKFIVINFVLIIFAAINGTPWTPSVSRYIQRNELKPQTDAQPEQVYRPPLLEVGGSSSVEIRRIVWEGAIDIWKHYPILGTGVETYAYSYYNFRPIAHNLVSEWDFLYNKAHNEYLNFAATTGTLGLGTYIILNLAMVIFILKNSTLLQKSKNKKPITELFQISILSGLLSIYATNFFGFSVVPVNLMMFLLPAFSYAYTSKIVDVPESNKSLDNNQKTATGVAGIVTVIILISIFRYWYADVNYGQGKAHNDVGNFVNAVNLLEKSLSYSKKEAVIWTEYSEANLNLGLKLAEAQDERALQYIDKAVQASNTAVKLSPKDVNIRRKRASMFIKLAAFDPNQMLIAREELLKTIELAPTDAKLIYNLGLVYARMGEIDLARETFEKSIEYKADYEKARYAYALLLLELGEKEKALEQAQFILENIQPDYQPAIQFIEENS